MRDKNLDQVEPIHLGDMLFYPVNSKILEIIEDGDPTGQLVIQDNRFVILGPRLQQDPEHKDHISKEIQNV